MSVQTPLVQSFNNAQAQLVVQTADLPLGTLAGMVEANAINLEPDFQRRERWTPDKQSALIESFLLNVPVPPVYLAEEANGTYTAIDGKQRLKAIAEYLNNRFSLRNLERLKTAEGAKFNDLPSEITNALKLRPFLRVVTLLKQTDPLLKFEVFLRLNRGGESLNAQEIRNVAFRGSLNDEIYELSKNAFLRNRLKILNNKSIAYRDMNDVEYVLRFLTLNERMESFSGSLSGEMDDFMRHHQNPSAKVLSDISTSFSTTIARCEKLWGNRAFRRPEGNDWRDQTLAGMYDAQMLAASAISEVVFQKAADQTSILMNKTRKLFQDPEFDKAARAGTNTLARIRYRVRKMKEALEEI